MLLVAGLVAAAAIVAVAFAQRRNAAALAPLVLLLFLPTTAVAEHNPVLTAQSAFYPAGWTSPARAADGARSIAFDTDHPGGLYVYQWFASKARFVLFSGSSGRPPSRFVISSPGWGAGHRRLQPAALWNDAGRDREPSAWGTRAKAWRRHHDGARPCLRNVRPVANLGLMKRAIHAGQSFSTLHGVCPNRDGSVTGPGPVGRTTFYAVRE